MASATVHHCVVGQDYALGEFECCSHCNPLAPDNEWHGAGSSVDDLAFDTQDGRTHAVFETDAQKVYGAETRDAFYQILGDSEPLYVGSFLDVDAAKDVIRVLMGVEKYSSDLEYYLNRKPSVDDLLELSDWLR